MRESSRWKELGGRIILWVTYENVVTLARGGRTQVLGMCRLCIFMAFGFTDVPGLQYGLICQEKIIRPGKKTMFRINIKGFCLVSFTGCSQVPWCGVALRSLRRMSITGLSSTALLGLEKTRPEVLHLVICHCFSSPKSLISPPPLSICQRFYCLVQRSTGIRDNIILPGLETLNLFYIIAISPTLHISKILELNTLRVSNTKSRK